MRTPTLRLTRHPTGYFCKRIHGTLRYFGPRHGTEDQARESLLEFLRLGRVVKAQDNPPAEALSIKDIADAYRTDCRRRISDGSLQERTWEDYDAAIRQFVEGVGRRTLVTDLSPEAFGVVRKTWAGQYGAHRQDNSVQAIRTMFRWAVDEARLLPSMPIFGREFVKTTAGEKRDASRLHRLEHGERKFQPAELARIIKSKKLVGQLKCFVLLALNGGMYSSMISDLRWRDLRREGRGWIIDTTRRKTQVPQRFPLWPETASAIEAHRATVKDDSPDRLMFLTKFYGPWVDRTQHKDSIRLMFERLCKAAGVQREGLSFGAFRHTHVSSVEDHPDKNAAKLVRGHLISGTVGHYDYPATIRLRSVTDLARRRLLRKG